MRKKNKLPTPSYKLTKQIDDAFNKVASKFADLSQEEIESLGKRIDSHIEKLKGGL